MASPSVYIDACHGNPPTEFSEETQEACEAIKEAVKGWGTDEDGLISVIGSKTPEELHDIYYCYEETQGKKLDEVMKSECGSGDFGLALQFLVLPMDMGDAAMIKQGCKGVGAKEHILYPIFSARSNEEMAMLKEAFFKANSKDLAVELNDELGGDFESYVFHCLQGMEEPYDEEFHTAEKAEEDADLLYSKSQGKWGTDEKSVFEIICKAPPAHMQDIDKIYQAKYEKNLQEMLDSELGGDIERAARFAVSFKLDPAKAIAETIRKSCKGMGTDELLLTCTVIRYRKWLNEANEKHQEMYGKTIAERIEEETRGKFKLLLSAVATTCSAGSE